MAGEKIYEMLWDCEYCGTRKLLGKTHRHCPNCGATQDPNRRYFPEEADKVAVTDHIYYGADRVCPFCKTPNGAKSTFCGNCGGSLDGSKEVERKIDPNLATASQQNSNQPNSNSDSNLAFKDSKWIKAHEKTPKWVKWMLGGGTSGILGFLLVGVLWTESVKIHVTKHEWERAIAIEQFQPVSESEWCDSMPSEAYSVTRSREVRSYNQVADGEDCSTVRTDRGDGTYSESESCTTRYRDEPVYDSKCYYKIDKWAFDRNAEAKGIGLEVTPYWPVPSYRECVSTSLGCERLGNRSEKYLVHFEESEGETKGEKHDCEFDETKWKSYQPTVLYKVEKSVIFNFITCDSIQLYDSNLKQN